MRYTRLVIRLFSSLNRFMPLPPPTVSREPLHTRTIRAQAFARVDGQWDIEAELIDIKAYDFPHAKGGVHKAGTPVHHMLLRITINDELTITDAVAVYDAAPYGQLCVSISDAYQQLIGLNLVKGFRRAVRERFSKTAGCTHMTELTDVLPTVAIQSMANRVHSTNPPTGDEPVKPFHIDGCHAMHSSGEVVKVKYPRWYIAPQVEVAGV
ncbi:DUF2889 domain-containing protein [Paenalcaligenes niemegkensis]|uniref:DUF2889 domain-containing protein n=1 Tax=Paenalcaligenes niemegkensis TaxID=2895469 RepID=UPI0027E357B0|nr:DUF2889 domain-containing protein [Paenalcaligenes niemegkensis]